MHSGAEGADPIPRILFLHRWIPMMEETVGGRTRSYDAGLLEVKQDGFGALGPAVDPESDHGA
jgi:hypothetical protein